MDIIQKPAHPSNYTVGRLGGGPISHIVIHVEAGTEAGTISWFANPNAHVSAHYSIRKDGQVFQHVAEQNTAWHAGLPYPYTWADPAAQPDPKHPRNPNCYTIGIEHEGMGGPEPWPLAQVEASAGLVADICRRYSIPCDRTRIVRHSQIYAGHACPGPGCPIDLIVAKAAARLADAEPLPPAA